MPSVFITGITGFLGSAIAEYLLGKGCEVIGLYREAASMEKLKGLSAIKWVCAKDADWEEQVIREAPDVVLHGAWLGGVDHEGRTNWQQQAENVVFISKILDLARRSGSTRFIGLGSQAEYGTMNAPAVEGQELFPAEAYGVIKTLCAQLVRRYSELNGMSWCWLRLFSFYGKNEGEKWLIPALVKRCIETDSMDLTPGGQQYAYLYVDDLGLAIHNIIIAPDGPSGIYNISGSTLITLKHLVQRIRDAVNPAMQLNFGAVAYRENQSMLLCGDSSSFINAFGAYHVSDFDHTLTTTVEFLKDKFLKKPVNESI